jgi:hypothetical protein
MRFSPTLILYGAMAWGALSAESAVRSDATFQTNGPIVYQVFTTSKTNLSRNPRFAQTNDLDALSKRLPPDVFERIKQMLLRQPEFLTNAYTITNLVFSRFAPGSLNEFAWTNLLASTNGRSLLIWAKRQHPLLWPMTAPSVQWNTQSLIWGMKGLTALSPCWEKEGSSGQVPITLLTRRHGYARGHGMGREGLVSTFRGKKVWFVTAANKVVETRGSSVMVRSQPAQDYSILMFDGDLPSDIEPVRVASLTELNIRCPAVHETPSLIVRTEQEGRVSAELPGFTVPVYKGGDSGSPNLFFYGHELVFVGGRTTSPPQKEWQDDINALCAKESVDPKRYQLQWVDLSKWPAYEPGRW